MSHGFDDVVIDAVHRMPGQIHRTVIFGVVAVTCFCSLDPRLGVPRNEREPLRRAPSDIVGVSGLALIAPVNQGTSKRSRSYSAQPAIIPAWR